LEGTGAIDHLHRSWAPAGIDDFRSAPLDNLTRRRLAAVASEAKPRPALKVAA
jgi:hypothetical protein